MIKLPLVATDRYIGKCPKNWRLVIWKQHRYDRYSFYPEPCKKCDYERRLEGIKTRRAQGRVTRKDNKDKRKKARIRLVAAMKELYSDLDYVKNPYIVLMPSDNSDE